jgi:Cu(I)/Ag(I) efflux system periplasmic protein CusF
MKNTLTLTLNITLSAALLAFSALSSNAQTVVPAAPAVAATPAAAMPAAKDLADAEVRKVDKEAKKVTLKHGPIKNLDMPSMTMVFQVRDEKLFDKLVAGEKIKFSAEQLQGAYVVTGVEKAETK